MSSQKTEDNKNEIEYYDKIGNLGIDHTLNKQFSENDGGRLLTEFALVLMLLPKPPLKILDLGCGTGWTSFFLAKCGYDVIGVDLSPLAIYHANIKKRKTGLTNIKFEEGNYEDLNYKVIELMKQLQIKIEHPLPSHKSNFRKARENEITFDSEIMDKMLEVFAPDFETYNELKG